MTTSVDQNARPGVMHLIEDETITLPIFGRDLSFRLRIWRAKGVPAAVLVSRLDGGPSPRARTCRLANFVYRALLGFLPEGMDYFESDGAEVEHVTFEGVGAKDRLVLTRPVRIDVAPWEIDHLVGTHVEL